MGRSAGLWRYAAAAVLRLPHRSPTPQVRVPWLDRSTSSYEAPLAGTDVLQLGRAAQLPPFGRGNGVEALFWTRLARLGADRVDAVLAALADADIAAWVAPAPRAARSDPAAEQDLWVASLRVDAAQDLLMAVLRTPPRP